MTPVEAWTASVDEKHERDEEQWTELRATVRALVSQAQRGQLGEAHALARAALRIEYDLTGDCDATSALCDALGIPVDATDG